MQDYTKLTDTELQAVKAELNGKYGKLYKLAEKLASEMDSLSNEYKMVEKEISSRNKKG